MDWTTEPEKLKDKFMKQVVSMNSNFDTECIEDGETRPSKKQKVNDVYNLFGKYFSLFY